MSKDEHEEPLNMDLCCQPDRIKDTGRIWTVTNGRGENCEYFDKDKQLRFGVDL